MIPIRKSAFRAVALAALTFAALPAGAQYGGGLQGIDMDSGDIERAIEAATTLYESGEEVGAQTLWDNPETGALGMVEIVAIEEDGRCIEVKHLVRASKGAKVQQIEGRRCRGDDGEWRSAPKQ